MQQFEVIWKTDWIDILLSMQWWGWLIIVATLALGLLLTVNREIGRGVGDILLFVLLLAMVVVITILIGIEFAIIAPFLLPIVLGLVAGGTIGLFFSASGSGEKCPDCGGQIVTETFVDRKSKAQGKRTLCKRCGRKWHESLSNADAP